MDKSTPTPASVPASKPLTGLRKRQQIEVTNKHIFIWIAITSVVVSFCIIALQFLVKEFLFNQKVINEKSATNKQIIANISAGKELTNNVNKLLADKNLGSVQRQTDEEATTLNVVLDALPVKGDATSFANSLQAVVLPQSGVSIKELSTSVGETDEFIAEATATSEVPTLPFKAGFTGSYEQIQKALVDISRVIRPISLTKLTIRSDDDSKLQVAIEGHTYYQPARTIEIKKEMRKP